MIYKLNEKEYETKEVTFKEVVKMEKCGVNFNNMDDATFTQAEALISYITGLPKNKVDIEIEEHLKKGGNIEEVLLCFKMLTESDFFKKVGVKN